MVSAHPRRRRRDDQAWREVRTISQLHGSHRRRCGRGSPARLRSLQPDPAGKHVRSALLGGTAPRAQAPGRVVRRTSAGARGSYGPDAGGPRDPNRRRPQRRRLGSRSAHPHAWRHRERGSSRAGDEGASSRASGQGDPGRAHAAVRRRSSGKARDLSCDPCAGARRPREAMRIDRSLGRARRRTALGRTELAAASGTLGVRQPPSTSHNKSRCTARVLIRLILVGVLCCGGVSCSSAGSGPDRHAAHRPSPSATPTRTQVVACPHATAPTSPHRSVRILLANGTGAPGSVDRVVVRPGTRIVATARMMGALFRDPAATNKAVLARLAVHRHPRRPVSVTATFLAVRPGRSRIVANERPARGIGLFGVSTIVRVRCGTLPSPAAQRHEVHNVVAAAAGPIQSANSPQEFHERPPMTTTAKPQNRRSEALFVDLRRLPGPA